MSYIRLPLEGVPNARELGGYPTQDNKITKRKVFIRSSRLTDLTAKDNDFLKEYGVTDIIDLRGKPEIQDTFVSDDNLTEGYFNFHYIPLSNVQGDEYIIANSENPNFDFGYCYSLMAQNKTRVKQIFETLETAKGAVLFHCTAGKDRTGIISALLLGLCNVANMDIIANYEVTYTYIKNEPFMGKYFSLLEESRASYMENFLKIIQEEYGSIENYLLSCDISRSTLENIKAKFLMEE